MNLNQFFDPSDDAEVVKFSAPGDSVAGLIVREPESAPDKFNPKEQVVIITVDTESGFKRLFCRRPQLRAIARAAQEVGSTEVATGGWLKLTYSGDRDLDNGRTARDWEAEYKPGSAEDYIGVAELGETGDDAWASA